MISTKAVDTSYEMGQKVGKALFGNTTKALVKIGAVVVTGVVSIFSFILGIFYFKESEG